MEEPGIENSTWPERKQTGSPQGLEVQREQEWLVSLHSDTDILKLNSGAACVIP